MTHIERFSPLSYAVSLSWILLCLLLLARAVPAGAVERSQYMTDMWIRTQVAPAYTGDNIYSIDGAGQTRDSATHPGVPVMYLLRVQNDGRSTDSFMLTGPAGNTAWNIRYFKGSTQHEITELVTGVGWTTLPLPPGAATALTLVVKPLPGAAIGTPFPVLVTATSAGNTENKDAVKAVTMCRLPEARYQPDLWIRNAGELQFIGDNRYNLDGTEQTKGREVPAGETASFFLRVQNDANTVDTVTLRGPAGNAQWSVRYFTQEPLVEITAAVTGDGWNSGPIPPQASRGVMVSVRALPALTAVAELAVPVLGVSAHNADRKDVVKCITRAVPPAPRYQPDLWIRVDGEPDYSGDNVYNLNGEGQTRARTVAIGVPAVYILRAQNDANTSDSITITGPAGGNGWNIRYFDMETHADITPAVTGGGWVVGPLPRMASRAFIVMVKAESGVLGSVVKPVLVQAASAGNPERKDVARMLTTAVPPPPLFRADMWIRKINEQQFAGDNIYNLTGEQQTREMPATPTTPAAFVLRAQNDGNTVDTLKITGPTGSDGWSIRYFELESGNEITAAVTGDGWSTGSLSRFMSRGIILYVKPVVAVSASMTRAVLVTATSLGNAERPDVIRAIAIATAPPASAQPDMWIRTAPEQQFVGDNIYNLTGEQQTRTMPAIPAQAARYIIRVQNDGSSAERFLVRGTPGSQGWLARYLAPQGQDDLTEPITGNAGWLTPPIPAHEGLEFTLEVKPASAATPAVLTFPVLVGAASQTGNPQKKDAVRAITTLAAAPPPQAVYQPDLAVRLLSETAVVGDNVYNTTGDGQQKATGARPSQPAVYFIHMQNDGNTTDTFTVTGPTPPQSWVITYTDAATQQDVTAQVTTTGWTTSSISAHESKGLLVTVQPADVITAGTILNVLVTATSTGNTEKQDAVKMQTTRL